MGQTSRRNLLFVLLSLLALSPALGQPLTLSKMYQRIDQSFPDNVAGRIKASDLRSRFKDIALMLDQRGTPDAQPMSQNQVRAMSSVTVTTPPRAVVVTDTYKQGVFFADLSDTITPDNGGTVLVTADGTRYKRQGYAGIDPCWFGAIPNDNIDDAPAIQAAIDEAYKSGGVDTYRRLPVTNRPGVFIIGTTVSIANLNGMYLVGSSGLYQNTFFQGRTGNTPIVDATGATLSGLSDIQLGSFNGDTNPSSIGVQFALSKDSNGNQLGGLNCGMSNVSIVLASLIGVNGNLGSVGVINCRAEEFTMNKVVIRANLATVFTNTHQLLPATGYNYTVSSQYASVMDNATGSMGVIKITGVSFQNIEKTGPAMLLNGTNGVDFQGLLSRAAITPGRPQDTYETAVRCTQTTISLRLHGTCESFGQLLNIQNDFQNADINVACANQTDPTRPIIQLDPQFGKIKGGSFRIAIPNVGERDGRYLVYAAPVTGGNEPAQASINDAEITCHDIFNNAFLCTPNLLKNCDNVRFNGTLPVWIESGIIRQVASRPVSAGSVGSLAAVAVSTFTVADRTTKTSQNAGSYTVRLNGTVTAGGYGAGCRAVARYTVNATYVQRFDGAANNSWVITATLVDKTSYAPACLSIDGLTATIDQSNPNAVRIKLLPTVSGSGTGEPVKLDFRTELQSDFYVNRSMLIAN